MDRNEILQKAQAQKGFDEMETQIVQRNSTAAMWAGLAFTVVLMFGKMLAGQPWQDLYSVYGSMLAAANLYKWHRLKQRWSLISGLLWAATAVLLAAAYLWQLFG